MTKITEYTIIRHFRENVPYKKVNRKLGHFPPNGITVNQFI